MPALYRVHLTPEQRADLITFTRRGSANARELARARALLLADRGLRDPEIATATGLSARTVQRIRRRMVEDDLQAAVRDRPRPGATPMLDGAGAAVLVAVACTDPPVGHARWTMQLLANQLVALEVVPSISADTVRRTLEKNDLKPWQRQHWCIPSVNPTYVARMEDLLDLYAEPFDPAAPVVCVDEYPLALTAPTRPDLPLQPGRPRRVDFEYERRGSCSLFAAFQPLAGWRSVVVHDRRTAQDFAHFLRDLVDQHFPSAPRIRLVLDNLNTHHPAALYSTFPAAEARRIAARLEWHYTPAHGSWLNMIEIEWSVLSQQCLGARRLGDMATVQRDVGAWAAARNAAQATVRWQFTTTDARRTLAKIYPHLEQDELLPLVLPSADKDAA